MPITIVGFFLLQPAGIGEEDLEQISRCSRRIDRPFKAELHDPRQVAGVIDMSVSDYHGVQRRRVERRLFPVALAEFAFTLKEAAIDQHAAPVRFEQIFRARDGPDAAVEGDSCHTGRL